ncbi:MULTISPECIES: hypothetical protein [Halomonadaceae]|uniref:hypothetical protein n=1 Tax=Halomonadaceae TaxID=28256 RepID=UPI000C32B28D|nr:hypothetical protein [Halomonas sp. MES3-P3E]PKG47711.1 hypothetical protein CXF87_19335 [Halomonas sp. MES3-P3E]
MKTLAINQQCATEIAQPIVIYLLPTDWVDVVNGERAEYPISRGVDATRAYVSGETLPSPAPQKQDDYFSATLLMFAHMAEAMR